MTDRKRFLEKQLTHAEEKNLGRVITHESSHKGGVTVTEEVLGARRNPRLVTLEMYPGGRKRGVKAP